MNKINSPFTLNLCLSKDSPPTTIQVHHDTETFDFSIEGKQISILNNGDNSWSEAGNTLDQQTVNLIGQQIEVHYKNSTL